MSALSIGKIKNLRACATARGHFTILAADHRDALRVMIAPDAPNNVPAAALTEIKLDIVRHLAPAASAVLLDPIYSAAQALASEHWPGGTGLLCALEEQGYLGDAFSRRTPMLEGWSVEKSRQLGANGVKILLFYHPDSGAAAEAQDVLVRSIVEDCRRHEIPFFLEPISYPLDPKIKKNSPEFARARRRVVIESARRLSALGADVMKVEFPLDAGHDSDPGLWTEACAELNEACAAPWALLSAGEPFETFKDQLRVACRAGCSGFVAGRALWQEAAKLSGAERDKFLSETAYRRLRELSDITEEYGAAWHDTSRLRLRFP